MSDIHYRWIARLRRTWPEGVPAQEPIAIKAGAPREVEPWPETQRDEIVKQCLHCRYYVPLTGDLGADWGACTCEASQYDGRLVFEHWTCREYREEEQPDLF